MSALTRNTYRAKLLSDCIQTRLRISQDISKKHTYDLYTLSENHSHWGHQAEQLGMSMVSILKAHGDMNDKAHIILVSGNVDNPPVVSPLTAATQQLILRPADKEPMIWAFCSKYFWNETHEGPDAVVKSLIIQLEHKGFFSSEGFDYEMDCSEFDFAMELLKDMLSPNQEKLGRGLDDLWIVLDYPSFFKTPQNWLEKMEKVLTMLADTVRANSSLRLLVTDPVKLDKNIHRALGSCARLSWETGEGEEGGWFDIEEP